jgi:hypothetical protein
VILFILAGLVALAAPPTADVPADPAVMRVNLRDVTRSELAAAIAEQPDGSVKAALSFLGRRAVLLQEADRSGLGKGLPAEPSVRARAFLERVISERVICGNIAPRELNRMYQVMKPRYVRGDLYRVGELRWHCGGPGDPETAGCREQATSWADERWQPLLSQLKDAMDLYWVGLLSRAPAALRYVEFTFMVGPSGRSSVPPAVAMSVQGMQVGDAQVLTGDAGARIQVLLEHQPPVSRLLEDADVAAEVHAELCQRLVEKNRSNYVEGLFSTAYVTIQRELLPAGHDVPGDAFDSALPR